MLTPALFSLGVLLLLAHKSVRAAIPESDFIANSMVSIDSHFCLSGEVIAKDNQSPTTSGCFCQTFQLAHFTERTLLESFMSTDESAKNVRQVRVNFMHMKNTAKEFAAIGAVIDKFITPRIWWQVMQEPYAWQHQNHSTILLQKYNVTYEPHLRLLSAIQYPDAATCDRAPMIVGKENMVLPGTPTLTHSVDHVYCQF